MTELNILWLCPILIPTIPPAGITDDVKFHRCCNLYEIEELLARLVSPHFDAVVVDTTRAQREGYDPVDMVAQVAATCVKPPRYLFAVVIPGVDDPLDSQMAFAVELQNLWSRKKPELVIENAVRYYLEQRPGEIGKSSRSKESPAKESPAKESSVGQVRRWADIANRAAMVAAGEVLAETSPVSPLTRIFVTGMCAKSRRSSPAYFNDSQRDLLFELAQHRLSVRGLAEKLSHDRDYIRRLQAQIADQLVPHMPQAGSPSQRPDHAEFCNALVERFGPWLLSRYERASRLPPARS